MHVTAQNNATVACNAWVYCGVIGGCQNTTTNYSATKNECSLYYASDLDYNVPLDKNVGVVRGPDVTFTSGETNPLFMAQQMFALQGESIISYVLRHSIVQLKVWPLAKTLYHRPNVHLQSARVTVWAETEAAHLEPERRQK